ncbi:porin family protein [Flavobacterium sp. RHBU_3]|uniref:porin family protein n=1 Tax=Flavobacterium sp. RHBU_3 TaxID=3391184 RepID=UPI003984EDB0
MKKLFIAAIMVLGTYTAQAQGVDFGIKAGANFANFNGDADTKSVTSWHAGAVLELSLVPTFSIQGEALYSSQGAKIDGGEDIKLDYVQVPVLAKFYIIPDRISLVAGPQFSFLTKDTEDFKAKSTDIGLAGGVEAKIVAGLFAQARYTIGLNNINDDEVSGDVKNAVFQLSLGYNFF